MILAKGKTIHVFGEGTGHICVRLAGKRHLPDVPMADGMSLFQP